MEEKYAIKFLNITKNFGNLVANDNISLKVKIGFIHGLIGENGAGKSTLMNQLFGLLKPTSGEIIVDGKKVSISNPNIASELGLSMAHQHFQLVENHSILENVILGDVVNDLVKPIDYQKSRMKLVNISKKYKLKINPNLIVKKASIGMQQRIEILKMLYKGAKVLIFDEPTAMLTPQEIDSLLNLFVYLKKKGKTIIFISHKLHEVKKVADEATVIRKGKVIKTFNVKTTSTTKMAEMMVGRKLIEVKNLSAYNPGKTLLEIKNISVKHKSNPKALGLKNFSLNIKEGEIVAIAGVEGNGQIELVNAIFGLAKLTQGKIMIWTKNKKTNNYHMTQLKNGNVRQRYDLKLSFVPEDRYKFAMLTKENLFQNVILQSFRKKPYQKWGFLVRKPKIDWTTKIINEFDVRGSKGGFSVIGELSGGNQQKFIVGREMTRMHKLIILFQPTRGLDIGAIEFIHQKMLEEKAKRNAVLLVSYELSEVMALADRVAVVNQGNLINVAQIKGLNRELIGKWMAGIR